MPVAITCVKHTFTLFYSLLRGWSDWHEMLSDDLNPLQQLLQQQQRTNNSGNDGVFTLEASSQHKPDGNLFTLPESHLFVGRRTRLDNNCLSFYSIFSF